MSKYFRNDEWTVTCERTGMEHLISVALPARYGTIEDPPIILCMDGPWMFGPVVGATRVMGFDGDVPEAIVVGVSFLTERSSELTRQRARWFTPTPFVPPPRTGVRGVEAEECGKAHITVDFLRTQLLPELGEKYVHGERWYVGHSFSSLLGLQALFSHPELFSRWLLASPSIWWDNRAPLAAEEQWAESNTDLDAAIFMAIGGLEPDVDPEGNRYDMVANMQELRQRLESRNYPNLHVTSQVLPGETHSSTIGTALSAGLRWLHAVR